MPSAPIGLVAARVAAAVVARLSSTPLDAVQLAHRRPDAPAAGEHVPLRAWRGTHGNSWALRVGEAASEPPRALSCRLSPARPGCGPSRSEPAATKRSSSTCGSEETRVAATLGLGASAATSERSTLSTPMASASAARRANS
eukprot:6277927-Prymnesium_polylepis.1